MKRKGNTKYFNCIQLNKNVEKKNLCKTNLQDANLD